MIDLHSHTNNSDGSDSTIELLKNATEANIDILSITDHDTVKAHYEIDNINVKDYYNGKLIVGAEFNSYFDNCKIELLGYNFNKDGINSFIRALPTRQESLEFEFNEIIKNCKNNNLKLSENLKYYDKNKYPTSIIYKDLKKYEENRVKLGEEVWKRSDLFYRKCTTDENFILYSSNYYKFLPKAEDVSDIIRKNGGKVFLAHLYSYEMKDHLSFLKKLVENNILDGVECYYSKFSKNQIDTLVNFCKENNLLISGGSDYHGFRSPGISLGTGRGDLKVEKKDIEEWI